MIHIFFGGWHLFHSPSIKFKLKDLVKGNLKYFYENTSITDKSTALEREFWQVFPYLELIFEFRLFPLMRFIMFNHNMTKGLSNFIHDYENTLHTQNL